MAVDSAVIEEVRAGYEQALARRPLADNTRRAYRTQVGRFLDWLAATDLDDGRDPLADPHGRDYAARDYRSHLVTVARARPATVRLALAAVDSLYRHLGLGPPKVRRERLPKTAPKGLSPAEAKRFLRAIEREPSVRDRAFALLLWHAGLRIAEAAALDVTDLAISARKGVVRVTGKGEVLREVPLHPEARDALEQWLVARAQLPDAAGVTTSALFISRAGARLTTRSLDRIIRRLAQEAQVEASAHTLRHTWATRLVRGGADVVLVAELAGHARLDTTRGYTLPSDEDREAAIAVGGVEY